jgi:sigma-54 dependent transcriptional regulator, acetoin dehydrogenase operon transcriptional activator AcoR
MSGMDVNHVRRVHSAIQKGMCLNGGADVKNPITKSWIRCFKEYQLDPGSQRDIVVIGRPELEERQDRIADVLEVATVEMANLYQQLAGSGYAIMLTDRDGVVLNYFGDPSFTHAASKSGLLQGAVWSESAQGTNGMGTCLCESRPLIIHRDEHYLTKNTGITCAAAPIYDYRGELIAALDASGESRLAQQHTLVLINMSVHMIENRVFQHQFRNAYIVHFHGRPEFVGTLNEGLIAFSPDGVVLGATRTALFQLDLRAPVDVQGLQIGELFNASLPVLVENSLSKGFHPIPIFDVRRGGRFYAVAYSPEPITRASRATALPRSRQKTENLLAEGVRSQLDELQFGDATMENNIIAAKRVFERDVAILLYGETGTGKEWFAKALHQSGSRASKPFVAINCASIPESLIESELFGYKSGAFTGASREGQRGKLFQANGGTLFLDEIGDMPFPLQARLLRVLEEREILPLGSDTPFKIDVRVISATHCDLMKKIEVREFREDLYYRLHGLKVTLPPLRGRGDKRALIRRILETESHGIGDIGMDDELLGAFMHYEWPGNLRELRNVLRTMVALRTSNMLTIHDLPPGFAGVVAQHVADRDGVSEQAASLNSLENAEREALIQELAHHHWNISNVAKKLKVSRNTLYRKLQRLNIKESDKVPFH